MVAAIIIIAVLLVAMEILLLYKTLEIGKKCSVHTEGTVKSIETIEAGANGFMGKRPYPRYNVYYNYQYNNESYTMQGISRIRQPKCQFGDLEPVMLNPNKPSEAYTAFDRRQIIGDHISTLAMILILAIIAIIYFA